MTVFIMFKPRKLTVYVTALGILSGSLCFRPQLVYAEEALGSKRLEPIIKLIPTGDGSVNAEFRPNAFADFTLSPVDRILQIDDTFTKGKLTSDLQNLLDPSKASVTLMVLSSPHDQLSVRNLKKNTENGRIGNHSFNGVLNAIDAFDRPGLFRNSLSTAKNNEKFGFTLFVGALLKDLLNHCPYRHPSISDSEVLIALPFAVSFFDKSGMFESSDFAINKAVEGSKVAMKNRSKPEILALSALAVYLSRTNRLESSNKIWMNIIATINGARVPEQIACMQQYADFLKHNPKLGDAKPIYKRVEALCLQNLSSDEALKALSDCANFFLAIKDLQSAQNDLRALADANKLAADKNSDKLMRFQRYVKTLSRLADLFAASGDYPNAIASLKEALTTYNSNFGTEELVRLERASSPCLSEIQAQLGVVLGKSGDSDEGKKLLQSAISMIETNLTATASQLKFPLNALALLYRNEGKEAEATQLSKRSASLSSPVVEPATSSDVDTDFFQMRDACQFIASKDFKRAESIVQNQLDQHKTQTALDPFFASRVIAVANAYRQASDPTAAQSLLKRMLLMTESDNVTPTQHEVNLAIRSQILVELAILTNDDADFRELGKALYDLEDAAYPQRRQNGRDDGGSVGMERNWTRLFYLSLGLRFSGRPKDAAIIAQKILSSTKENSSSWTSAIFQLVLCQIEANDYKTAFKTYSTAFPSAPRIQLFDKLVMIADAFIWRKQTAFAEEILKSLVSMLNLNSVNSFDQPRMLASLGSLEYRLGHLSQAEKYFGEKSKSGQVGGLRNFDERDYAAVLEAQGKQQEALRAYLKASLAEKQSLNLDGPFLYVSLPKALTLFKQEKDGDAASVSLLRQVLQTSPIEQQSMSMSEEILQIVQAQSAKLSGDPVCVEDLRNIYEHENKPELAASLSPRNTKSSSISTTSTSINAGDDRAIRDQIAIETQNKNLDKVSDLVVNLLVLDSKNEQSRMMAHPGNRKADLCLATFENAGRFDLAQKVLKRAIELEKAKTAAPFLASSTLNSALLVDEYAKGKNANESMKLADVVLLQFDAHPEQIIASQSSWHGGAGGGPDCSASLEVLLWSVQSLLATHDYDSAESMNNKLFAFFQKHVGPKNKIFIDIFQNKAIIAGGKKDAKAEGGYFAQAMDIANWYWGKDSQGQSALRTLYASFLRESGRTAEAEKLQRVDTKYVRPPDEKDLYGDKHVRSSHSPPPETYAEGAASAMLDWLTESQSVTGQTSPDTLRVIDSLLDYYYARLQYGEASKLLQKKLQLWRDTEGACSDRQSLCLQQLAVVVFLEGNKKGASDLLKEAEVANRFNNPLNSVPIAALQLELGNRAAATRILLAAAKKYERPHAIVANDQTFSECAYLLTCLDQVNEVAKLTALYETVMAPIKNYRGFGGYGWARRITDPHYELVNSVWTRKTRAMEIAQREAQSMTYRAHPSEGQLKSQRATIERMRGHAPDDVVNRIEAMQEKQKLVWIQKSNDAEANKKKLEEQDKLMHDYATQRIRALQQAQDSLTSR